MSNKAVTLTGFDAANPTSTIKITDLPIPQPGDGEVLVKMKLSPVNPADLFSLMGVYPGFQPSEGTTPIPGLEGVGIVESVGPNCSSLKPGDRVVGCPFNSVEHGIGTWQQYIVAKESCLYAINDSNITDEAACQFWVNPVTVFGLLEVLQTDKAPAGSYIVQTAAGSVLGRQLIQVAKAKGLKTINIVRREALVDELKAIGADEVIVSTEGNYDAIPAKVMELTGGAGAWGAVECVSGDLFQYVASSVRANGIAIIYGAMNGMVSSFNIVDVLFRNVTIKGFWLVPYMAQKSAEERTKLFDEIASMMASGVVVPFSGKKFTLDQVVEAVGESTTAARGGKVFIQQNE